VNECLSFGSFPRYVKNTYYIEASSMVWTCLDPLVDVFVATNDISYTVGPSAFIMSPKTTSASTKQGHISNWKSSTRDPLILLIKANMIEPQASLGMDTGILLNAFIQHPSSDSISQSRILLECLLRGLIVGVMVGVHHHAQRVYVGPHFGIVPLFCRCL